jgi:hypothetical protein
MSSRNARIHRAGECKFADRLIGRNQQRSRGSAGLNDATGLKGRGKSVPVRYRSARPAAGFEGVTQDDRSPAAGSVIPRVSGV